MSLQVPPTQDPTQVDHSLLQDPVVKANESSGCLDALISKIWSCVQAVLNFLTCGCFSSSSKQESVGSPVDPSRVQQLSQQGENGSGSEISPPLPLQEPESDPSGSFSEVKRVGNINVERQTRLKETLNSWQEAIQACFNPMENDFQTQIKIVNSLVDKANVLIEQGADVKECDPNGLMLNTVINSLISRRGMTQEARSELEMVSILLTGGVQLQEQDLQRILLQAIRGASSCEGSVEFLKLFIEKRKEAIVQCDRDQQLLVTAAQQVNNAIFFADTQLQILKMLMDAGLGIKGAELKQILWNALENYYNDPCRKLIIQFIEERREAVLECDPGRNLFRLANTQAKNAISNQVEKDLQFIAFWIDSARK